jgi:hypothetical protein
VLEFIKPNMFEKRTENKEARKESVTEELYYVRSEGFLGNAFIVVDKGCNGYTCDINNAHKFTREQARKTFVKTSRFSLSLIRGQPGNSQK